LFDEEHIYERKTVERKSTRLSETLEVVKLITAWRLRLLSPWM